MTTSDIIKQICDEQNVSIAELSRRIGQSRQNLSKKLKRQTLTFDEMVMIANALGVVYEQSFMLPDGRNYKIGN